MQGDTFLQPRDLFLILSGIVMGTVARLLTLKVDTRQHPSYPTGSFINIVIGFLAATLGAVAIPALLAKDFTAVTFLSLGIQHFREVRKIETESLNRLEQSEFTHRGSAYIDGIAKTYESRNYIALVTALMTVLILRICYTPYWAVNALIAIATGLMTLFAIQRLIKGKRIGDICTVNRGQICVRESELYVDGMYVTNTLGLQYIRELFEKEGIAFVITPTNEKFRIPLDNLGQRQAILFDAVRSFGVKQVPFAQRNDAEGKVIIAFVPIIRNPEAIQHSIQNTPVLESTRKIHSIMSAYRQ